MPNEEESHPISESTIKDPTNTTEEQKHAHDTKPPSKGVKPARKVLGVLPEKFEEEKKTPTFFWPYLELTDELILMAPQFI